MTIKENIAEIEKNVGDAAEKSGRKREDITLIAVTKLHSISEIEEAVEAGISDLAENKVQELLRKHDEIEENVNWHLIGHLQRNKVRKIIGKVKMIHSVDSLRLAKEINKRSKSEDIITDILIQVNAAEDEAKFGITTEETKDMVKEISEKMDHVRIRGLMTIAPWFKNTEEARPVFREMKKLYDDLAEQDYPGTDFKYLSMGMSNDYAVAIEEGSNMVRVGTAIFGKRDYRSEEK